MSRAGSKCSGCGGGLFEGSYTLADQPVILNYRFESAEEAQRIQRSDLELVQCANCGLVFNALFDPALVPYDARYENTQTHSPAFTSYLEGIASDLDSLYHLEGKRVLEVGCGKGDFLKRLCEATGCEGAGYDTTYEGPLEFWEPELRFYPRYLTAGEVQERFDLVVCRHVVEHVPAIGDFLKELNGISRACGDPVVLIETPRLEWIIENDAFWDVFYEHCNYYTEDALARLCERAGFRVERQEATFGSQYQILTLKVGSSELASRVRPPVPADLPGFARRVQVQKRRVVEALESQRDGEGWAIWGAGAKGVALANQLPYPPPACVIDVNPAKQRCFISGTAVPIVGPDDERALAARVVLVSNANYLEEIKLQMAKLGFKNAVIAL